MPTSCRLYKPVSPQLLFLFSFLFSSPSQCKGITRVSEDSSETVYVLVENYNYDDCSSWTFGPGGNFWKPHRQRPEMRPPFITRRPLMGRCREGTMILELLLAAGITRSMMVSRNGRPESG